MLQLTGLLGSPMYHVLKAQKETHVMPLFNSLAWIGGLAIQFLVLHFGGTILLFDAYSEKILPCLAEENVTAVLTYPMVLRDLCEVLQKKYHRHHHHFFHRLGLISITHSFSSDGRKLRNPLNGLQR